MYFGFNLSFIHFHGNISKHAGYSEGKLIQYIFLSSTVINTYSVFKTEVNQRILLRKEKIQQKKKDKDICYHIQMPHINEELAT